MSDDPAEKRQSFERWVSALRKDAGGSPVIVEESGVTSLDEQATLVQRLPKDVVRQLREREAGRHFAVDPDSTAIFQPPPDLIARARRLVPPAKPERSTPPSAPAEPETQSLPTPVVAPPHSAEAVVPAEPRAAPLPALSDAVETDEPPPVTPSSLEPDSAPPITLAPPFRRSSSFGRPAVWLGSAFVGASAWLVLTHRDWVIQTLSQLLR